MRTKHGRIGVGICYDIEFPELTRGLALDGAELLVFPTNWPRDASPQSSEPMLQLLARATAYLNRVFVAVCDRGGSERGLAFLGGTVISPLKALRWRPRHRARLPRRCRPNAT